MMSLQNYSDLLRLSSFYTEILCFQLLWWWGNLSVSKGFKLLIKIITQSCWEFLTFEPTAFLPRQVLRMTEWMILRGSVLVSLPNIQSFITFLHNFITGGHKSSPVGRPGEPKTGSRSLLQFTARLFGALEHVLVTWNCTEYDRKTKHFLWEMSQVAHLIMKYWPNMWSIDLV